MPPTPAASRQMWECWLQGLKKPLELPPELPALRLLLVRPERLTPLGFPLWADRMQASHVSSETWGERVRRMAEQLEKAADAPARTKRTHRQTTTA